MSTKLKGSLLTSLLMYHSLLLADDLSPNLGKEITKDKVNSISITVLPDGRGLPVGNGTAKQGEVLYQTQCQSCHGIEGQNGITKALAGKPKKGIDWSVGSAWPHATSIYSYIKRAMPPFSPKKLTKDETYALTAYILYVNELATYGQIIDQTSLPKIKMPSQEYTSSKWENTEKHIKE